MKQLLSLLVLITYLTATPPDAYYEDPLHPIAQSDSTSVWQLIEESNRGTYYCVDKRWSYITINHYTGEFTRDIQGRLNSCVSVNNPEYCNSEIEPTIEVGTGRNIGQILVETGANRYAREYSQYDEFLRNDQYSFSRTDTLDSITIHLNTFSKKIPIMNTVSYIDSDFTPVGNWIRISTFANKTATTIIESCDNWVINIKTGDVEDEVVRVNNTFIISSYNWNHARSYFHNLEGLSFYQQNDNYTAIHHFNRSMDLDPTNVTPIFNAACACALENDQSMWEYLSKAIELKGFDWVKQKVDSDSDFEDIRDSDDFIERFEALNLEQ